MIFLLIFHSVVINDPESFKAINQFLRLTILGKAITSYVWYVWQIEKMWITKIYLLEPGMFDLHQLALSFSSIICWMIQEDYSDYIWKNSRVNKKYLQHF